jgi:hypothetical protein
MQTSVAQSSMEAEYMAASAATQEAMWQARLLEQMGMCIDLPMKLYKDNKSAIMFTNHPGDYRTIKHIDTCEEFARYVQTKGIIEMVFGPTAKLLADGMTKALPYSTFLAISLKNYLYYYEFSLH